MAGCRNQWVLSPVLFSVRGIAFLSRICSDNSESFCRISARLYDCVFVFDGKEKKWLTAAPAPSHSGYTPTESCTGTEQTS
jgi:hypothetical protein